MGLEKAGCPSDSCCTSYNFGEGRKICLSCPKIEQTASKGNHYHRGLLTDDEMIQDVTDSQKMKSIFECLSRIEPELRAIFEDYQFSNISMNEIARQRGMTRQQVYRTIRSVRYDCKKMLGLSTVF